MTIHWLGGHLTGNVGARRYPSAVAGCLIPADGLDENPAMWWSQCLCVGLALVRRVLAGLRVAAARLCTGRQRVAWLEQGLRPVEALMGAEEWRTVSVWRRFRRPFCAWVKAVARSVGAQAKLVGYPCFGG